MKIFFKWVKFYWRYIDLFPPPNSPAPKCPWCGHRHHSTNAACDFTVIS